MRSSAVCEVVPFAQRLLTYAGLLARTRVHMLRVRASEFPGRCLEILKPVLVQICSETQLAQFVWEC